MPRRLLWLVAPTLLLAGCGKTAPQPVVPWRGDVPPALRAQATPAAPCRARNLKVVGDGFFFQQAGTGGRGTALLENTGTSPCRLAGRPARARFVGAPVMPKQRQVALGPLAPHFPAVVPPDNNLLALAPHARATITLDWSNWCVRGGETSATPLVPPRALRLTLAHGAGSIDVAYNAVAPCVTRDEPSTIGVRAFRPAPLEATPPWTTARVEARLLDAEGKDKPLTGKRGEVVPFVVELRNGSGSRTIAFDRCPLVEELLAPGGLPEVYLLNCRGAHPLEPGETLRFAMRIRVPMNAPPGPNGLFWELDPLGIQQPEIVGRLLVAD
jgi:hypothetical protein